MAEFEKAFYRPAERRLASLTNEELQAIFELRFAKAKIDPKGFWDDNKIVYWGNTRLLMELYEVMLEIQSRYPKQEICSSNGSGSAYFHRLLPVNELAWIEFAVKEYDRLAKWEEKHNGIKR